ncbi:MAG: InlB B-repeat-containing protein [Treponema sp.]|jgi:hypothetical protein|nr:InlB B-repeat-containing protein [Treponema sp.]
MLKKATVTFLILLLASCGDPTSSGPGVYSGFRVIYHVGEGQGVPPYPQTVAPGNIIELPTQEAMTHPTGKVLSGWRSNYGTTHKPYERYTVNRDVEFTAQWATSTNPGTPGGPGTPNSYTVTFNANGGSGTAPGAQTVNAGGNITLPSGSGLTKSGFTFGGWNTNTSGTGSNYNAGSTYTPTANITLYAKWGTTTITTPPTYTVTFDINGGEGPVPSPQTVNAGESITLPSGSALTKSYSVFNGWNAGKYGYDTTYPAGSKYTPTGAVRNITLYADWDYIYGYFVRQGYTQYEYCFFMAQYNSNCLVCWDGINVNPVNIILSASGNKITVTLYHTPSQGNRTVIVFTIVDARTLRDEDGELWVK